MNKKSYDSQSPSWKCEKAAEIKEIWRTVVGHTMYEVSNFGRVRSWTNNREHRRKYPKTLKAFNSNRLTPTYLRVNLRSNHKQQSMQVHTLVLTAFHGLPKDGQVCRHLDGDSKNNHADNLKWGTVKENCMDTMRHGRTLTGAKNASSKLTEKQAIKILNLSRGGLNDCEIAEKFKGIISRRNIHEITSGNSWKYLSKSVGVETDGEGR